MAVEDVWNPKSKVHIDPKKVDPRPASEDDPEYWEKKARGAAAKREYEEEERRRRMAEQQEYAPADPPFQVKGSVNLGEFNLMEQQNNLQNQLRLIQEEANNKIEALSREKDNYREELFKIQVNAVEQQMSTKIDSLTRLIQENSNKSSPGIIDQISQIEKMATTLGFVKPGANEDLPANLRLQMLKLEMEMKANERQFEWDKIEAQKNWDLKMEEIRAASAMKKMEIEEAERKRGMFIGPFEAIGAAIAKALQSGGMSGGNNEGNGTYIETENKFPPVTQRAGKKETLINIDAFEGESGTIICPKCNKPVAIAPTANSAVCAGCNAVFNINRITEEKGEEEDGSDRRAG